MTKSKIPTGIWKPAGQPILPTVKRADNTPLQIPVGYHRVASVPVYVTGKAVELRGEHASGCDHPLCGGPKPPWTFEKYPVGTLIPLLSAELKMHYLFMIDWHIHPRSDPVGPHVWHHGVTALPPETDVLFGRWLVTFKTGWSRYYTFRPKVVSWTDIRVPPQLSGEGTWSYIGDTIRIQWPKSSEEWDLPLVPIAQQGRSRVGQGDLSAVRVKN